MRRSTACGLVVVAAALSAAGAASESARPITLARAVGGVVTVSHATIGAEASEADARALDEMLRGSKGRRQRWQAAPQLVVLTSVMEYRSGEPADYPATEEVVSEAEIDQLIADLTGGLRLLTGGAFVRFADVRREPIPPGTLARVTRANTIVAGRYRGVRSQLNTIGLGGRASQADGTITAAAILLDSDFDRSSQARRLLRMHELGHALGYNHVQSRVSIMNPRIGPEPTDFDRRAALLAFRE